MQTPSAYLAGPDVFFPNWEEIGKDHVARLLKRGITGLFPMDNKIPEDSTDISLDIFFANVAMLDRSQIVIANIVPFRGDSLDPGTAWEIGYATAKGIPVVCYGSEGTLIDRCRKSGVCHLDSDKDEKGYTVENFKLVDNLMIARCAEAIVPTFADAIEAAVTILRANGFSDVA